MAGRCYNQPFPLYAMDNVDLGHVDEEMQGEDCPICLMEFELGEGTATIKTCKHYFHEKCLTEWLGHSSTCPLDRGYLGRRRP